jgi:hypothetical protein
VLSAHTPLLELAGAPVSGIRYQYHTVRYWYSDSVLSTRGEKLGYMGPVPVLGAPFICITYVLHHVKRIKGTVLCLLWRDF